VVQNTSLELGGRPVITHSAESNMYKAHHTRYLVSLDKCVTLSASLLRFIPIATADRIAMPITRHDLRRRKRLGGHCVSLSELETKDIPIDLSKGKEVEGS
jgi:hypothetical protein